MMPTSTRRRPAAAPKRRKPGPPVQSEKKPSRAWRLEAFDLRAGLAFTTLRETGQTRSIEDWPCFFLSPPAFTPEPVGNVGMALAARRGGFRDALVVDGVEAGFGSLNDVAEFVRRAYVSSGGGDGSDGGGEPDEPVPSPDDPLDLPGGDPNRGSGSPALLTDALNFAKASGKTPIGSSFAAKWSKESDADAAGLIAAGAALALKEVIRRAPRRQDAAFVRWLQSVRELGNAIASASLWPMVWSARMDQVLEALANQLRWSVLRRVPDEVRPVLLLAHGAPIDGDPDDWYDPWRFGVPLHGWTRTGIDDPSDFLRRMPIEKSVARMLPPDLGDKASLLNLLTAVIATPQLLETAADKHKAIQLVFFAAACIVSCHSSSPTTTTSLWAQYRRQPTMLELAAVQLIARDTIEWLVDQMPQRGFAHGLEEWIGEAKAQRYRAQPVGA